MFLMVCVIIGVILFGMFCVFLFECCCFFGKVFFEVVMSLLFCILVFVSCFMWISLIFWVEGFWGMIGIMMFSFFLLVYLFVFVILKRFDCLLEEISFFFGKSLIYIFWYVIFL